MTMADLNSVGLNLPLVLFAALCTVSKHDKYWLLLSDRETKNAITSAYLKCSYFRRLKKRERHAVKSRERNMAEKRNIL